MLGRAWFLASACWGVRRSSLVSHLEAYRWEAGHMAGDAVAGLKLPTRSHVATVPTRSGAHTERTHPGLATEVPRSERSQQVFKQPLHYA